MARSHKHTASQSAYNIECSKTKVSPRQAGGLSSEEAAREAMKVHAAYRQQQALWERLKAAQKADPQAHLPRFKRHIKFSDV